MSKLILAGIACVVAGMYQPSALNPGLNVAVDTEHRGKMANGDKKILPASPGPDIALRQSDAEDMQRALKGATTSRSEGMAHVALEKMNYGKSHKTLDR